jgi:hypothetical protein
MQSNNVGTKLALYWIAWAFIAEKGQNYQFADRIFQNGQNMNAEPKSLLSQRYQQFQRRVTRKYLTAMENGETFDPLPSSKPASTSTIPVPNSVPISCPPPLSQPSFAVFSDTDDSRIDFSFSNATFAKKQRSFLANENQRLKENIGVVETWTNPVLPRTTASANPSNGIVIFADPECVPTSTKFGKMPSILIPIFDDSQSSVPLPAVVNTSTVCSAANTNTVSSPIAEIKNEETNAIDAGEDHTINTKLALEDIEKMFADEDFF